LRSGAGSLYFGIVLVCVAGYLAFKHDLWRTRPTLPRQTANAGQQEVQARKGRAAKKTGGVDGSDAPAVGQPSTGKDGDASPAPFRVWSGSDGQTAEAESICSKQREVRGEKAYRACVRAQLAVITDATSAPDLIELSAGERESVESVCGEGDRVRGSDGYNRCLNIQMASLAEEPSRPNLSGLSDADRSSMEAACRSAKLRDGPAAYDRCLMRFVKMLAETK
jgi:hypothetical protein